MSTFNNQIKKLRQEHNLSQQELADKIGMSKSSVNMYERGEREPGIETVKRIADFFDVDVDYLFGISDIKKRRSFTIGEKTNRSIAHNIRHHREQAKLTQKQFADMLGVDEKTVAVIESGEEALNEEMLFMICDVLQLIPCNIIPTDEEKLSEDTKYLLSRQKGNLQLSNEEKMLLDLFRRASKDKQQMVLSLIRVALGIKEG